jgi:pSer/pThr/pTyr-binding forkhead associated (FHA) protein
MARLIYETVDGERQEIPIEGEPLSIGRGPEADVDLPDLEASRHHCALLLWEDDWVIKDAHSRNGTWVNEKQVGVAVLKDGDVIRIGKTEMDFHAEQPQRGRELYAVLKVLTTPNDAEEGEQEVGETEQEEKDES